ncbi:hypothetical protein NDU88_003239 [Pleurodeles waltl]|uniref:Uncharacterized protein n=1 Tax=Pleurodeles waltl TaxID=8319 RepID=A0AAV7KWY2_PLEWA|nr:hypothetical protein NDU88_003239 [Pleurodeles waltl]
MPRCHHATVQCRPHQLQLMWSRRPGLRLSCPPLVPKPFRGPGPLRLTLRSRIQTPGPARCIIQQRSSDRALLLGGHLAHAPRKIFLEEGVPSGSPLRKICLIPVNLHQSQEVANRKLVGRRSEFGDHVEELDEELRPLPEQTRKTASGLYLE